MHDENEHNAFLMSSTKFTAESMHASATLLTLGDVMKLRAEIEADVELLALLPARIAQKKKLYDAALLFAPANFGSMVEPDAGQPPAEVMVKQTELQQGDLDSTGKLTWIGEARRIISEADSGLSYADVLSKLKTLPLPPSAGDKGFYNSMARMEAKGEIVKAGGLVYSARLAQLHGLAPRTQTKPDVNLGGTSGIALAVLRAHPIGLKATEVKREFLRRPDCPESMRKHGHYIYSVLTKLIDNGSVTKDANGVYRAV